MQIFIDIPDEMYDWYDNGFPDEDDAEKLWQIIKNGTPLSKIGHWISDGRNKICSECNFKIDTWYDTDISGKELNYCPNCGAKMEVE